MATFSRFPRLTALHGFPMFVNTPEEENDPNLVWLVSHLPRIRRIDDWSRSIDGREVLVVESEGTEKIKWTRHKTDEDGAII
jgi:hypothetical protein